MNELQLLTTRKFNGITLNCYVEQDSSGDFWATREQIGAMLGYENPSNAITIIHKRNKARLDKFSTSVKLTQVEGDRTVTRDVRVYDFRGLLEICRYSNQPTADAVMDVLWDVADEIRRKGMYLTDGAIDLMDNDPEAFKRLLTQYAEEREKNRNLQEQISREQPYTILGHVVMARTDAISVKDAADLIAQHSIPTGQNRLYKKCRDEKLLCRRKGRQYNKPTRRAIEQGIFNAQVHEGFNTVALVTPKGLEYIYNLLLKENLPIVALLERNNTQSSNGQVAFHGTHRRRS